MCAIFGAMLYGSRLHPSQVEEANGILNYIVRKSRERGRDGFGYTVWEGDDTTGDRFVGNDLHFAFGNHKFFRGVGPAVVIGNLRAEPTTEYVKVKRPIDQQPYLTDTWGIVHNGTIANDKELRTGVVNTDIDSAAIAETLDGGSGMRHFIERVKRLKGSYAILAHDSLEPNCLYVACNYRPVWYIMTEHGVFFASSRSYFPATYVPQTIAPYSAMEFAMRGNAIQRAAATLCHNLPGKRALVVCSGGLDSVVAAKYAQSQLGMDITLIHFRYGSRAEGPEVKAIKAVAERLGVEVVLFPLPIYSKGDSPLLDENSTVAGGEAGAEFAHEWVPARNLVMLSVATAYAEAHGFDYIILGNNLEEAGAYPDNEPEFINKFNDLLPFAVGDGKSVRVIMPVGNLMKHEIVKLGLDIGAPLHLTWSCYRAGGKHCGTCGPCYMRRKAFEINKAQEVIEYEHN